MRLSNFWSGLAGVVAGALFVTAGPAVAGSVGDPFRLGEPNTVNAQSKLRGSVGSSNLLITNTGAGVPLDLRTKGNGEPPLIVDSKKRVVRLNADRLDTRHAHELIRVAGDFSTSLPDPPIVDQDLLTTTIEAPKAGILVMNGSLDSRAFGDANDPFNCEFNVDGSYVQGSFRSVKPAQSGTDDLADEEDCATTGWLVVDAGEYEVSFTVSGASDPQVSFQEGSMWVMWIGFDGEGKKPSP